MAFTRRSFLTRVGHIGGFGAAFTAMRALGLAPPETFALPIPAAPDSGNGVTVVILGGGIAGLVAAYELRALGYTCTVLEARSRPGGRNWTVRGGDEILLTDGSIQTCAFSKGLFQNAGPARLPSTHRNMLGYCRKFNIPLEVEINTSRSSLLQNDNANGGKPIVQRQAINDTRGHIAELLSKCVRSGGLDAEMTKADTVRILDFLRIYGPLDPANKYIGSDRAGFSIEPGTGDVTGTYSQPFSMHTLLDANFWDGLLYEENHDWQATMLQPVGGMDRIPYAFAERLGDMVQFNAPVIALNKTTRGVRVSYTQNSSQKILEADFCFCAMPLTTLRKVQADFSAPYLKVIEECTYSGSYKIAWESRRFWEQDYNIYGGLEFLTQGCSPVWFPSAGLSSERGVLVAGYDEVLNTPFAKLSMPEKFAASRASVERLHPGHGKELEKPIYVGWGQVPWSEGAWIASYGPNQPDHEASEMVAAGHNFNGKFANPGYETLLQPDGPIYFVGDHVSHLSGWQEGAALSSLRAIGLLNERVKAAERYGRPAAR